VLGGFKSPFVSCLNGGLIELVQNSLKDTGVFYRFRGIYFQMQYHRATRHDIEFVGIDNCFRTVCATFTNGGSA